MDNFEKRLHYKLTELEVTGETYVISEHMFQRLKELIEGDDHKYSLRRCADNPMHCETFIVK